MGILNYLLIFILVSVITFFFIYGFNMFRYRMKISKITKYADEIEIKLKNEGLDQYYKTLDNVELLKLHKELLNSFSQNDYKNTAETGVKDKFIEDILIERNVQIPTYE
jgi:hypothetical protein